MFPSPLSRRYIFPAAFAALTFLSPAAMAQVYSWKDPATGTTIISDTPPPGSVKNVTRSGRKPVSDTAKPETDMPFAAREAARKFPVVLYTGADCPACAEARALLTRRGVPFREILIQTEDDLTAMKHLFGGTSVPSAAIGRQKFSGFESGAYQNALDLAGYPKETPVKDAASPDGAASAPPANAK
ncbi:MAG: glutaredoxin family protein [Zoogloeaceae bacterium]|jgi:glutaredoxin|nr:glutaredoxin family protein [Zoogloeaceae bacterium]